MVASGKKRLEGFESGGPKRKHRRRYDVPDPSLRNLAIAHDNVAREGCDKKFQESSEIGAGELMDHSASR